MHDVDSRLRAYIDERRPDLVSFLSQLVAINSENPPGREEYVADAVATKLRELGVEDLQIVEPASGRANVLASIGHDRGTPSVMLCGHLDTKPIGERSAWRTDPHVPYVRDGRMYGLGTCDMKGAVAGMVYAFGALCQIGVPDNGAVSMALLADEEAGGDKGLAHVMSQDLLKGDVAIVGEPAGINADWQYLYTASRGECCFRVHVGGTQMHSSVADQIPSRNAVLRAAALMIAMEHELRFRWEGSGVPGDHVTFVPGIATTGGVTYGVLPAEAEFACEVRVPVGMTRSEVADAVDEFIAVSRDRDPSLDVRWEFEGGAMGWIAPSAISPDHRIVTAMAEAVRTVTGAPPTLASFPAWTDARILAEHGIPALPALGPGLLPNAHSPNEFVDLAAVVQGAHIYALGTSRYLSTVSRIQS